MSTAAAPMSTKPFHPAIVHFPIAFILLSSALDVLLHLTPTYLSATLSLPIPTLYIVSHNLLLLGLLLAIPTIMSGGAQMSKLIKRAGMYESDGQTMRPKIKTAFTHAACMDVAMVIGGARWYMNRKAVGGIAQGKAGNTLDLVLSVFSLGVMLFSADLGGTLVYNHGVGLAMGTKGKKTN